MYEVEGLEKGLNAAEARIGTLEILLNRVVEGLEKRLAAAEGKIETLLMLMNREFVSEDRLNHVKAIVCRPIDVGSDPIKPEA